VFRVMLDQKRAFSLGHDVVVARLGCRLALCIFEMFEAVPGEG